MRRAFAWLSSVAFVTISTNAHALRIVEIGFDDGNDETGVATGDATLLNVSAEASLLVATPVLPRLIGDALRTKIDEGRYGRGARLDGQGDGIELTGFQTLATAWTFYGYVRVDDNSSGWLFLAPKSIGFRLNQGVVEVAVYDATNGTFSGIPTTHTIAADGAFHQLLMYVDPTSRIASVSVDLATGDPKGPFSAIAPVQGEPVVGLDLKGIVDEIFITPGLPDDNDLFDFVPTYCGKGQGSLICAEESAIVTPEDWPRDEPVRYKTVLDPAQCSASSPCPLLIAMSDGGSCNDDYERVAAVTRFAKAGFHVVTVDPYCDASEEFYKKRFPSETSQVVFVKNRLFDSSYAFQSAIQGTNYVASGCSHGANVVARLALQEDDYPLRTFVRSGFMAMHCAYHAADDGLCPMIASKFDSFYGMTYPHDESDPGT